MLKQTCIVAAHRGGAANGGETAAQGETAAAKGAALRGETNGAGESRREKVGELGDPESDEEAQALGRPARDRRLPLPKTCEDRVVA